MKRKIGIGVLISLVVLSTLTIACATTDSVFDSRDEEIFKNENTRKYEVKNATDVDSLRNCSKADVVRTKGSLMLEASADNIKYMLAHSQINVVENIEQEELITLSKRINAEFNPVILSEGQKTVGAVITTNELGVTQISEVIAEVAAREFLGKVDETDVAKNEYFLNWLSENAILDIDGIYGDYYKTRMNASSRAVASSFGDTSIYRYLYTAPYEENSTEYESVKDSSRYLLATTKITIYGYKVKTSGTTTYDSFKAYFNVTPHNDLRLTSFNTNLYTPDNVKYDVLGATEIESDSSASSSRTITITLPTSALRGNTDISGALTHTYSYKTGGKNVKNRILHTKYKSTWEVSTISPEKNASYSITPGMVVKANKGKEENCIARASLSYLKLKRAPSAYWVSNKDVIVALKYKNHTQI